MCSFALCNTLYTFYEKSLKSLENAFFHVCLKLRTGHFDHFDGTKETNRKKNHFFIGIFIENVYFLLFHRVAHENKHSNMFIALDLKIFKSM